MSKEKDKVFIFGAGGHGKVILDILLESGIEVTGFLDDDKNKIGQDILGFKVLGNLSYVDKGGKIALGIGDNRIRYKIFMEAKKRDIKILSAVHPKAVVSRFAKIGEAAAIMAGAIINPAVVVEDGVVVNTGATVDHDCLLKEFCQIWPGAHLAGAVTVGEFSYVGTGAAVIRNICIGREVIIGAGAAVISDIPDKVKAIGVPAKIVKEKQDK